MKTVRKNNINVKKTVEKAIADDAEFHFYIDELDSADYMPTYAGNADEKYTFDNADSKFFEFIERKISENGIYLRICFVTGVKNDSQAVFAVEIGGDEKTFITNDLERVMIMEMADYGVKITSDEIIFGTTVDGGCVHTPYFAPFGSKNGNETYLSDENPLNRFLIGLIDEFLVE